MDLREYIIDKDASILEAMNLINQNSKGIVYVCKNKELIGALSDGNIRRHILNGGSLEAKAFEVANLEPKYLTQDSHEAPIEYMRMFKITSIPILNKNKEVVSIKFLNSDSVYEYKSLDIPVVIMAGGKGTRLKPFTNVLPKPLIPIGEKTITERIMDKFILFGCNNFNMIVNYKKELIKAYFSEEKKYQVEFIDEREFLGTAGGLKLINNKISSTFFMTNCDILVEEDYYEIVKRHKDSEAIVTMVCTLRNFSIPYGTVRLDGEGNVTHLEEKPQNSILVNTGMYVIEPRFIEYIPDKTFIHITDVIENCIRSGETVGMYPISENAWMDMGEMNELEKMKQKLNIEI